MHNPRDASIAKGLHMELEDIQQLARAEMAQIAAVEHATKRDSAIQKLNLFHEALVDWWVSNPSGTLNECASYFRYSPAWICTVMHTDLFKERMAKRQEEIFGEIRFAIKDRIEALAHASLQRMLERIPSMRDDDLRDSAELALQAMGITGSKASVKVSVNAPQQNNTIVVSKDDLQQARQLMQKGLDALPAPAVVLPATIEGSSRGDD